ncbi:segregation/condensation protein A [Selenomonas sp. TAMA-11512]|uniref:segregation and condensation protein A n=1 Tax=Selenomonas sp. TAMA-11512 TaxID=3095337 RepID=UPI003090B772|nr:segregation/condensation protein A [Selenomonas sp. TAMA-11512]
MNTYTVHLQAFEGPMDLLMHLIEKNKIDIYDIPIAVLTEQYLEYIKSMEEFDIEIASEFLLMAATLLQIKARMMLPKPPKQEEESEEDPRHELIERILEYRRFQAVSETLDNMASMQEKHIARTPNLPPIRHFPPQGLSVSLLIEAFELAMIVQQELTIPEALVEPEVFSIQDKITDILTTLHRKQGRIFFRDTYPTGTKKEIITSFLALLELIKQKTIVICQTALFSNISIEIRLREEV